MNVTAVSLASASNVFLNSSTALMVGGLAYADTTSGGSTDTRADEEVAMSSSSEEDTKPCNRYGRRSAEAGHDHPRPERKFDRYGLGGILAFPMSEVKARLGISRSKAYEEVAAGRLKAVKCGTRTLIPYASGEAWLNNLPEVAA
jgi:excisionase family DNA binding protein